MKALLIHAKSFYYHLEHASQVADATAEKELGLEDCLVVLISAEEKDTSETIKKAAIEITIIAKKLNPNNLVIDAYPHLSGHLASPKIAKETIRNLAEMIKAICPSKIHNIPFGWYKAFNLSVLSHKYAQTFKSF